MAERNAAFVDAMMDTLVQKVFSVMGIADVLLQNQHISPEKYAHIYALKPTQTQMRVLYMTLNNTASKAVFYEALQKHEPYLLEELEKEYRISAANAAMGDSQGTSGNSASGSQFLSGPVPAPQHVPDSPRRHIEAVKEQWQRNSKEHGTKFEKLLRDPELKLLGKGKLLLCTKHEYKIGSGAEGTQVYIGMRDDGTEVAVKRIIRDNHKELKNEMMVLRDSRLEHKNIVKYLDFTEEGEFYYLCLQLCEYDFENYYRKMLEGKKVPDQDALKNVAKQMLLGLQALHDAKIIHRDLKPSNVLIDVEGNVRLADFGISRMLNQDRSKSKTSRVGSRGWEAAEILKGNEDGTCDYRTSADIQVAGMLVYYFLSGGNHLFGSPFEVESNILKGNYKLDEETDVEAKDLIEKMIARDPQNRPSVRETVEHPYFWDKKGREEFLRDVGDLQSIQKFTEANAELCEAVKEYTQFSDWKSKITDVQIDRKLPENLLGLLRFMRNRLVHHKEHFDKNLMYKDLFPEFFTSANQLAKDMRWK